MDDCSPEEVDLTASENSWKCTYFDKNIPWETF